MAAGKKPGLVSGSRAGITEMARLMQGWRRPFLPAVVPGDLFSGDNCLSHPGRGGVSLQSRLQLPLYSQLEYTPS